MKLNPNKSIVNQHCECGRKLNYFEMDELYQKEYVSPRHEYHKNLSIIILGTMLLAIILFIGYQISQPSYDRNMDMIYGIMFGYSFAVVFMGILSIHQSYNKKINYNAKKKLENYYIYHRRKRYWRKLNKINKFKVTFGFCMIFLPWIILWFIFLDFFMPFLLVRNFNHDIEPVIILALFAGALIVILEFLKRSDHRIINWSMNKYKSWLEQHNIDTYKLGLK